MISYLFFFMIFVSVIYGFITGRVDLINDTLLKSGAKSIDMILNLAPVLCLWLGVMRIALDSGLLKVLSKKLSFLLRPIFPEVEKDSLALSYIASNVIMNLFGLGNGATPFGLKAMNELSLENDNPEVASRSMITLLVINTAGVTLIPTTVISYRMLHHSKNPTEIIVPCMIVTFLSLLVGLLLDRLFSYLWRMR